LCPCMYFRITSPRFEPSWGRLMAVVTVLPSRTNDPTRVRREVLACSRSSCRCASTLFSELRLVPSSPWLRIRGRPTPQVTLRTHLGLHLDAPPGRGCSPARAPLQAAVSSDQSSDLGNRFGRVRRLPRMSAARRSASATQAAYTRSVVTPPPPWPSRPATVRMSTPAVMSSVAV
jgi:hypothetical protein